VCHGPTPVSNPVRAGLIRRAVPGVTVSVGFLVAVRRVCREHGGVLPSVGPVDELLDERRELDRKLTGS
jgi:hypothetical protein